MVKEAHTYFTIYFVKKYVLFYYEKSVYTDKMEQM